VATLDPELARPASPPRHEVTTDWDVRITVRDGIELSANIWRPVPHADDPTATRFPAILELIPYGKDNWRRNADVGRGEYFARRGYAFCRVDVRGTGSSGGIALDEYTEAETRDGAECVEWLAAQDWNDGNVAMWGISYGGFTSIQVAKLRPPHLRAIVPIMATDDRYTTDVHYIGGCVTASELSQYAVSQVAMNAMPPDVGLRGPGWIDEWRARLDATPPWLFEWLRRQRDGPYWRPGSLAPDYEAIEVPILNVGGWMDSYVDAALRMQALCTAPSRTIVGNWVHDMPAEATPGPNLDELHEMVRFYDRWLRGRGSDEQPDPPLTWFERDYAPPEPFPKAWPGRWRSAEAFPHPSVELRSLAFAAGELPLTGRMDEAAPPDGFVERYRHRATTGTQAALSWGAGSAPNGLSRDLRPDEAFGPVFTSEPLEAPVSILGFPEVVLHLAASAPVATAVVRLAGRGARRDVGPGDGRDPEPDAPPLARHPGAARARPRRGGARSSCAGRATGSRPATGSGYRSPRRRGRSCGRHRSAAELELHGGRATPSRLILPVVPAAGGPGDLPPPAFKTTPPDVADVSLGGSADEPRWEILEDVIDGSVTVTIHDGGSDALHDGRRLYAAETIWLTARNEDPARTLLDADVVYRWWELDHTIEIRARSTQASDATAFDLSVDLEVDLDGASFFARRWEERIPRDLV
jgi:putative CocE/NonD family hydrolase